MKKLLISTLFSILLLICSVSNIHAQTQPDTFYRAKVLAIVDQGETINDTGTNPFQEVELQILDGDKKGTKMAINYGKDVALTNSQLVKVGDTVVVVKTSGPEGNAIYQISDQYRLGAVWPILIIFFLIVIILSQWKGVGSILGMIISLGVIIRYIIPQILSGQNPLVVSIIGCFVIMIVTIYLAHGFSKMTTIAVVSTFLTLIGIGLISALFVKLTFLTGLGSEDASSLRFGVTSNIDFRGLFLGGIIIGALGVLDDVTTGLSASIFELAKANPKFKFKQLFLSGLSIGKEHVSSLVNTLVLAYAGSSMPIFLILVLNPNHYPIWTVLNDGLIVEEIVRTISGSIGLVAAVPLTTFMAAFFVAKINKTK